ncbi:uncharacterized protein LOC135223052 [Macrobrachium nipponense]|uniref:uncharacterized protein LOC135223052 n=1 Tax=Macrobrachium nipponense TaxID=159736 RepID=UPI0030C8A912
MGGGGGRGYIIPPSNQPYSLSGSNDNHMAYNMYQSWVTSWNYLKEVIKAIFSDEPPGFFVEAGALDGEYISNTLDLERLSGWEGLLVEVDEELFSRLKKKNRKAWISNACLATFPYPHQTILVKFENHGMPDDRLALPLKGNNVLMQSKDLDEKMTIGLPVYQPAQCFPLQTLLLAINVTNVNLISLDVEGVEMDVLNSFFSSKGTITVDVWIVEHQHHNSNLEDNDHVDRHFIYWFQSKGYTLYTFGSYSPKDYIFIRNGSSIYEKSFSSRPAKFIKTF